MPTKTISIMDDVYKLLIMNKLYNESFSDELRRVFSKKKSIMEFAGVLTSMDSSKRVKEMKRDARVIRDSLSKDMLKRVTVR